jgi:thiamine-monophosphate kinase
MESTLITWLRERLPPHPLLKLGIGDDAAVVNMAGVDQCVITVDAITDHVDFELSRGDDPRRIGRKALAVNLSDLAAMAARPLAAVIALVLPKQNGFQLAQALYEGMLPLAEKYDLGIAGGDTNSWDGPLVISINVFGKVTARGPLRRGGAKPGDRLLATGSFGGSIVNKHFDFQPRVNEALRLNDRYQLHAGIDVSDGLSIDLARMAKESGCGAILQIDTIPIADDAHLLSLKSADGLSPLDHALSDGEDFELLLAVPPGEANKILADQPLKVQITDIGEFVPDLGLWQCDSIGQKLPLAPKGWEHVFG